MSSVLAHLLEQPDCDVCIDGDEGQQPGQPNGQPSQPPRALPEFKETPISQTRAAAKAATQPATQPTARPALPTNEVEFLAAVGCDLPPIAAAKLGITTAEFNELQRKCLKPKVWRPVHKADAVDRDMWKSAVCTKIKWIRELKTAEAHELTNTGEEIQDMILKTPAGHELFRENIRPYYDIDIKDLPGKTKADTKAYKTKWNKILCDSHRAISEHWPHCTIHTFSSSGRTSADTYKISFHFIVGGAGYYKAGSDIPPLAVEGFDPAAYSGPGKRQCLRLPYAEAGKSAEFPRIKQYVKIADGGPGATDLDDVCEDMADALQYWQYENWLPSFIHGERLQVVEHPKYAKQSEDKRAKRSTPAVGTAAEEAAKLAALLAIIPNTDVIAWDDWRAIIWAAKQHACLSDCYAEGLDAVQAWSAKSSKHNEQETANMWRAGRDEQAGGYTIATLHHYAKEHNRAEYYTWVKSRAKVSRSKFNRKDPYCWYHFAEQYEKSHWPSYDAMVNAVMKDAPRVIAYIRSKAGWYMQKIDCEQAIYTPIDDLKKENFTMTYNVDKVTPAKGKQPEARTLETKTAKLCDFLRDSLVKFQSVTCDFSDEPDPAKFNTYDGMAAVNLPDGHDPAVIAPLLSFLFNTVSSNNVEVYEYLMNLLARVVQNPTQPVGVAIVLHGIQGTGKDTFVEFLCDFLFGKHLYCGFSGLEAATAKFNAEQQGKKLFYISEAASTQETYMSNYQIMKGLITSTIRWIEAKGQGRYSVPAADFWLISTNNKFSVYLDDSDRRHFMLSMNPLTANDIEYFTRLREQIMTEEVGNHFYTYLMSYKASRALLAKIPKTELREIMLEASSNSVVKFARHKRDMMRLIANPTPAQLASYKVSGQVLFDEYKAWCSGSNEKFLSGTVFGRDFSDYYTKTRSNVGVVYDLTAPLKW
jgi:hypothetical protein